MNTPNLMPCPDCGALVSRNAYLCPRCGNKIRSTPVNLLAEIILGFIAVCVVCSIAAALFNGITAAVPVNDPDASTVRRIEREQQEKYLKELEERQKQAAK
jgi:hypothetical protein